MTIIDCRRLVSAVAIALPLLVIGGGFGPSPGLSPEPAGSINLPSEAAGAQSSTGMAGKNQPATMPSVWLAGVSAELQSSGQKRSHPSRANSRALPSEVKRSLANKITGASLGLVCYKLSHNQTLVGQKPSGTS